MKKPLLILLVILGLTLAVGSPAFASTIFYLNTNETSGSPPANTIEVDVTLASTGTDNTATVTFTNLDPSDTTYNFVNVFLNVNGGSAIGTGLGTCTASTTCSYITGTGTGNGPYYYASNQGTGSYGAMTYNVDNQWTPASSVTVDLIATGGNSWASSSNVLTLDASGYEAAAQLDRANGDIQVAGNGTALVATPEPSGTLLLGGGLLVRSKDKLQRAA